MKLLNVLCKPVLLLLFCCCINYCYSQSLIGIYGGAIIGGKLEQNGETYNSGLGWEIGYSESVGEDVELVFEMDLRLIEIGKINYFGKEYKSLFDMYGGPGITWGSIKMRALIGYSFSAWIDNAISGGKLGALSFKLAIDAALSEECSVGLFYRPSKQILMDNSGIGFTILPSFGIRLALWM